MTSHESERKTRKTRVDPKLRAALLVQGVETEPVSEVLQQLGCWTMQGYLFSRPVAANELTTLLRRQSCIPGHVASAGRIAAGGRKGCAGSKAREGERQLEVAPLAHREEAVDPAADVAAKGGRVFRQT